MRWLGPVLAGLLLLVAGCTDSSHASTPERVVVFAASSLTEPFQRMGKVIERENPGVQVTFSFGGSSSLAPQIVSGAPADVFAAANPDTMQLAIDGSAVAVEPETFARNRLEIAVPVGNEAGVLRLEDVSDPDVKLALCAPEVPCGALAQRLLKEAEVVAHPVTFEEDVKAVLSKVLLGEVDAGLVYHSDVVAADGEVVGIEIPEADAVANDYVIAPVRDAPNPQGAELFIDFVLSERGQAILRDAGFESP